MLFGVGSAQHAVRQLNNRTFRHLHRLFAALSSLSRPAAPVTTLSASSSAARAKDSISFCAWASCSSPTQCGASGLCWCAGSRLLFQLA